MTSTTLTSPRSSRRVRDRAPVALVLIGVVVAVFALIPLIHVVTYASTVDAEVVREQLFRPRIGMLLRNTLGLMVTCVAASIARSEEHTSDLQSLMPSPYGCFCLKKKKRN